MSDLDLKLQKIIEGKIQYKSDNLGLNLLISRLQRKYTAKNTPDELNVCVQEMNTFLEKYKAITAKDITAIEKL